MASSADALLKLELQANGENANTWGTKTNTNLSLVAEAIAKSTPITLGSVNVTLTDTQFASNQSRSLALDLSGTMSANCDVIIPARSKMYIVRNGTTGSFVARVGVTGGTFATIAQNSVAVVWCDGTNTTMIASNSVVSGDASTLGGIAAALYARLDVHQDWSKGQAVNFNVLTDAAVVTLDASLSNNFRVTLAGNRTLAISSAKDGQRLELWIIQDGTGGRTLAWPSNVYFVGGVAPTLSTAAAARDRVRMTYNLALDIWLANADSAFAASGASTYTLDLDTNQSNVAAFYRVGQPSTAVTVNVRVRPGVIISSLSRGAPALDLSGFAVGSTVNVINEGYIIGRGGRGGCGGFGADSDTTIYTGPGAPGEAGGNAINGVGASRTLNITNAAGRIWGGGGGGGGGGTNAGSNDQCAGGGGGGGCGYGGGSDGGAAGQLGVNGRGGPGLASVGDVAGTPGTGGAAYSLGAAVGGAGGAGGDFGAAGSAGASPTGGGNESPGGAAGAAGKAVEYNGGSANFLSGSGSPNVKGATS